MNMKKKNSIAIITFFFVIFSMFISACGNRKDVEYYPGMVQPDSSNNEAAAEASIEDAKYSDGKVYYTVRSRQGKTAYKVDAEVTGNPTDTYPVYDIKYIDMRDQDIYNYSALLVGAREANYLLPLDIADEEYLTNRLVLLQERRDKRLEKGLEVPHSITVEMEEIQKLLGEDFSKRFTVPTPKVPLFVDLHDYYEAEYGVDVDLKFSFSENEMPDGTIVRFDVIKYRGNTISRYYNADYNYETGNKYNLASSEAMLPVSFDKIDAEECRARAESLLEALNFSGMECSAVFPACDYGALTPEGEHAYNKPAYCCFFSQGVNGRIRPCNGATDYCSNNMTTTRPIINAGNITTIFAAGTEEYNYGEYTVAAGPDVTYDSFCVCIGEDDRLVEVLATNIIDRNIEVKTDKAKLLSFEDADACAQKFLIYSAELDVEEGERTIDSVELGMCRAIGETGNMFMVPAWYYMLKSTDENPLREPVMAVNAIDGSIIDVQAGGLTKTF